MAVKQSSEALRRPSGLLFVIFPVIGFVSAIMGFIGLHLFLSRSPGDTTRTIDFIYYDLQLFVLGSDPLQMPGPYPLLLDIARFTAPAVTIGAAVETIRRLLAVELSRVRARRAHGHTIVCGDSLFADALTRTLRADGKDVIEIRTEVDEFVTAGEPIRIIGDARDPEVLRSAGADHAAMIYACSTDSATNIAITMTVNRTVSTTGPRLYTYSLISDPDFCASVQARFLVEPVNRRVRSDFFNSDHIASRRLFRDQSLLSGSTGTDAPAEGPADPPTAPPRLLVAGTDGFAQAIVVEAARCWRAASTPDTGPLTLILVGNDAAATAEELQFCYPFLTEVCAITTKRDDLLDLIRRGLVSSPPPTHAFITHTNEEFALKTAMTAERHWRGQTQITVRLDGALIGLTSPEHRLTGFPSAMHAFGVVGAAADPSLIRDDLTERIARVLHDHYVRGRRARETRAFGRAMTAWDQLPPRLQQSNRLQAEDIGRKLKDIGYAISPRHMRERAVELTSREEDLLARMEHERWLKEQQQHGWRYANVFDEQRKQHPGLVSWSRLDQVMKERNYDPIRALPTILGDAGFQIVQA